MPYRPGVPEPVKHLYEACKHVDAQKRSYGWGGGHYPQRLATIKPSQSLDCSSSVALVLARAGFWQQTYAPHSSQFYLSGKPGQGKWFTVYYNNRHVWIQFYNVSTSFNRFDTSPWADIRGRGPRLRRTWRPHIGFNARHYNSY